MDNDDNVILKQALFDSATQLGKAREKETVTQLFDNTNPFRLFNIIGKNQLFLGFIILLILYAWFIRAEISLGAILGLLFLGYMFYIYYQYQFYQIKDFTVDKQQKINFLAQLLGDTNTYPIEGSLFSNPNYSNLGQEQLRNFLYFNPAVVDFYYNNRAFIKHSYLNYARSLQHINAMTILLNEILLGANNRRNQLEELEYLRKECLNYWQSIIHRMPSTNASNYKYQESLNVLSELTQQYINNAQTKIQQMNAEEGINMDYTPIYKLGAKPNDIGTYGYNNHFDFFY